MARPMGLMVTAHHVKPHGTLESHIGHIHLFKANTTADKPTLPMRGVVEMTLHVMAAELTSGDREFTVAALNLCLNVHEFLVAV